MPSRSFLFLCATAAVLLAPFSPTNAFASRNAPKTAIVLASFGSTVTEARDVEAAFVRETEKRYAGTRVVLANTARMVMAKNAKAGIRVPSLFRVMADLADEGYTHVAVQSLHVLPGAEFDGMRAVAEAQENLPKGIARVSVGAPLLASTEDCGNVAAALIASLPRERKTSDPAIFVGHGTHHGIGNMVYPALQWHLTRLDPTVFVSTIEGTPDQETTFALLGKAPGKNASVWIAPLLGLAGDHAVNDLYGDEDDSWKSLLTGKGWQVKESFTPLLSIPALRDIWFAHLDAAIEALDIPAKGQ